MAHGRRGAVCESCALEALRVLRRPTAPPQDPEQALLKNLHLPTLFPAARKLARVLSRPSPLIPPSRLESQSHRHHVLVAGPSGCGKTRLALALREVAPTAIVDVAQITGSGHSGVPLTTVARALLREAEGEQARAERGIIVLDNLDCWLQAPSDPTRRSLWWELLQLLEGSNIVSGGESVLKTDDVLFIGLVRTRTPPPTSELVPYLQNLGIPDALLGRTPVKIALPQPDAVALQALLTDEIHPLLKEFGVTKSARTLLAERAAALNLGAWGVHHVLRELDLLLDRETHRPKRVDRRYLERRLDAPMTAL